jgi:hypothetical protein
MKTKLLETFADKSINHFFQFVKFELLGDESLLKLGLNEKQVKALKANQKPAPEYVKETYLDVDGLVAEGLNEAQIELLKADLVERGLLPEGAGEEKPKEEKEDADKKSVKKSKSKE